MPQKAAGAGAAFDPMASLAEQPLPADFALTLNNNAPWGWAFNFAPDVFQYNGESYPSPFKLGKGNRLVKDDIYQAACFFTSDVDLEDITLCFFDDSADEEGIWTELSAVQKLRNNIKANTKYAVTVKVMATSTASGSSPAENQFVLKAGINTKEQPVLTFTKFEVVKI